MGAAARRPRPPRLAQPRPADRRADRRVRRPQPQGRRRARPGHGRGIEARLRDYVEDRVGNHIKRAGRLSETVRLREFWTLGRSASGQLDARARSSRAPRARTRSTRRSSPPRGPTSRGCATRRWSRARCRRGPERTPRSPRSPTSTSTGDAHAAALDLSLADGRFAPDVLEVAARRAVDAWAEAVDGDDARLRSIAHGQAVRELLHPGDPSGRTRLVVRGPAGQADPDHRARRRRRSRRR